MGSGQWDAVVPTGYQLVPVQVGTAGQEASGNWGVQTPRQRATHNQHTGDGKPGRRPGKALKMEGQSAGSGRSGGGLSLREPLRTKEERLRNQQRYEDMRAQRRARSKEDDICFYCHGLGHYAGQCELKRADMEDALSWTRTVDRSIVARTVHETFGGRKGPHLIARRQELGTRKESSTEEAQGA
ncbi:hypothetical protein GN958_ATG20944 [Phytophthora infestans]|uniref:CCHC-type domain-containing protein n=1 Tax=Phytophthora infestans TaxID=4787 RepID=A0A8S9TGA9_PHYIN|nr:hypothetical protein GN958_ATG23256 [Phytophthora infestans]KAF4129867.1 hypothetical protein GN958_ATG20944 [Phytophthora infestans]